MGRRKKYEKDQEDKKVSMPKLNLSAETTRGIAVVVFIALALVVLLALANLAGSLGLQLLNGLSWMFGVMSYVVPLILVSVAVSLYKQDLAQEDKQGSSFYLRIYLGAILLTGSIGGLIHIFYLNSQVNGFDLASEGKGGGFVGAVFAQPLYGFLGFWAGSLILVALIIIGLLITFDISLRSFLSKKPAEEITTPIPTELYKPSSLKINAMGKEGFVEEKVFDKNKKINDDEIEKQPGSQTIQPSKVINIGKTAAIQLEAMSVQDRKDWKLPQFDLLDDNKTDVDSGNIEVNVAIIKKTLADFGIEVEMGEVNVGPTVTQYTLRPATGIKLSQIAALQNDFEIDKVNLQSHLMSLPK